MKVQSIYNSNIVKRGLKFAADNGALFAATATLVFSAIRPAIILATPGTDKKNKQYAGTKSVASTLIGYLLMFGASKPIAKAVKNIDENPQKYLTAEAIKNLKAGEKTLAASKKYAFATQLFKLGLGFIIAAPKAILTCALIPPIMSKLFPQKEDNKQQSQGRVSLKQSTPAFTGLYERVTEKFSKGIAKEINTARVQKLADKFHNTRFEQHIISLTDMLATGAFIHSANKSKKIEQDRKKTLIYNSAIATGISVGGGYVIDSLTKKPTERFIEKFREANRGSKEIEKYVEGIRVAKPVLILGTLYYIFVPLISTFLADKFSKEK